MRPLEIENKNHLKQERRAAIGIDFGTTYSLIALSKNGKVTLLQDELERYLIPSIFGAMSSVKRLLGKTSQEIADTPSLSIIVKDFIKKSQGCWPIFSLENDNIEGQKTELTLPEIISYILSYLKNFAEKQLNEQVKDIVLTIPAYFDNVAKGQLILAAKLSGLNIIRLIAEPTAAAYAYGLHKNTKGSYLVYDLGGGTFDISLLDITTGVLQVIATNGDNLLGGDDIDNAIVDYLLERYKLDVQKNNSEIRNIARKLKEELSFSPLAKIFYLNREITLDLQNFENIVSPIIERTIYLVRRLINEYKNKIDNLEAIILVGGSTKIPLIKKRLVQEFNLQVLDDIACQTVVAQGAAMQAENLLYQNSSLLIDVLPLSLGIELYGGLVEKIILRNTSLPFSITKEFTNYADNQQAISFNIVQGERELAKDCRLIAHFELSSLPPAPANSLRIEVTFSIDIDGILSVSAFERTSNLLQTISVKPNFGLDEEQINAIIESSYENAAVDHKARLLKEKTMLANILMNHLDKVLKEVVIYKEFYEDHYQDKLLIEQIINDLSIAIKKEDLADINIKLEQLNAKSEKFLTEFVNFSIAKELKGKNLKDI